MQDASMAMGRTFLSTVPVALAFTILVRYWACNPAEPWWRKRDLMTDAVYWFVVPLISRYLRIGLLVAVGFLLLGANTPDDIVGLYVNGHGPLSRLPLWIQTVIFVLASEVILYWMHRLFHRLPLWRFHAVHHMPEELEWTSAARFHPVNIMLGTVMADVILLGAGISTEVMIYLGPFNIIYSAFVHANLNWTLGPLKYVLAGPVFHRWHHTLPHEGGDKNFAPTLAFLDVLFGTFHMPKGKLPAVYGIEDKTFPKGFGAQFLYPLRRT
ncbi:MAG: sterol desaturase family protein [Alphaproteobacteria bacterium]|nr:sterol desaturase family protein [Alphaproteobacteria bacterium]